MLNNPIISATISFLIDECNKLKGKRAIRLLYTIAKLNRLTKREIDHPDLTSDENKS